MTNCSSCQDAAKIKGSELLECTRYRYEFNVELARKQKLCDNKTNYTPLITEEK